jgi:hypothetical protein
MSTVKELLLRFAEDFTIAAKFSQLNKDCKELYQTVPKNFSRQNNSSFPSRFALIYRESFVNLFIMYPDMPG